MYSIFLLCVCYVFNLLAVCLQDSVLEGLADLKQHPTETAHTSSITVLPLILNKEVLEEVCCHGSVSKVVGVGSAACEILGSLVHLREELFRPELLESLLQWMPYIEVVPLLLQPGWLATSGMASYIRGG